jgi:hypothetical protein
MKIEFNGERSRHHLSPQLHKQTRQTAANRSRSTVSANLRFATCRFPHPTRFVLVNDRVPRNDRHCALCGGTIEKSYVRDFKTGLIYCDTQCFAGGTYNLTKSVMKTAMFVGTPSLDGPLDVILESSQRRLP